MALPQPLHIFRKDLIHLWPETLFCLLLFVGFAACAPSGWSGSEYATYIVILSWLIKVLMPISWLVLIARAIQDESLVGDRQFWTSRPYHWASLLASKLILILTCIYIPFFLMQVYLLHRAGLYPMLALPALLHNLLLLTVVLIIPLAALSAVTSTFPRVLLSFIGAVIYVLILLVAVGFSRLLQMQPPHLEWLINSAFILLPAVALLIQYKTRKTTIARAVLVATPLLTALIVYLIPNNAIITQGYPVLSGDKAPALTGLSDKFHPQGTPPGILVTLRGMVPIGLPVGIANIQKDVNFLVRGTRVTVSGGGTTYTSPFLSSIAGNTQFSDGRPVALVNFFLPVDVFNKIRTTPVDLHIQFASEQLKAEKPSTWHATLLPFSVPGNGICSFPPSDPEQDPNNAPPPTCRYALKQPEISFVTAQLAAQSCANPAAPPVTGQANIGGSASTLDFDPVITVPLDFQTGDPEKRHHYVLCPGTALNFVEAQTLPNASLTLDQKQVTLDPFAQRREDPREQRPQMPPQQSAPEPQ
jgi:hypothetical protein